MYKEKAFLRIDDLFLHVCFCILNLDFTHIKRYNIKYIQIIFTY